MTEQEFINLYNENLDKVFRFVFLRVDSTEIAQDLTHQSFLKLWRSNNNNIKNTKAFLFQIARNELIDYYRKRNSNPLSLDALEENGIEIPSNSFQNKIELNFEMEKLKKALNQIKSEYSEIIIWHYIDNLSIKEISEILNKKENNVRVLLHRALEALKALINTDKNTDNIEKHG
ncbi:MAG: RNA polymerase sigma factor [Minisyncoccia bacterium]